MGYRRDKEINIKLEAIEEIISTSNTFKAETINSFFKDVEDIESYMLNPTKDKEFIHKLINSFKSTTKRFIGGSYTASFNELFSHLNTLIEGSKYDEKIDDYNCEYILSVLKKGKILSYREVIAISMHETTKPILENYYTEFEHMYNVDDNVIELIKLCKNRYKIDIAEIFSHYREFKKIYNLIVEIVIHVIKKSINSELEQKRLSTKAFKDDTAYLVGILKNTKNEILNALEEDYPKGDYLTDFIEVTEKLFTIWVYNINCNMQRSNKSFTSLKKILDINELFYINNKKIIKRLYEVFYNLNEFYAKYKQSFKPKKLLCYFILRSVDYDFELTKQIMTMRIKNENEKDTFIMDRRHFPILCSDFKK